MFKKKYRVASIALILSANLSYASTLTMKSSGTDTTLDGHYVSDPQNADVLISDNGKIMVHKIKSEKKPAFLADYGIYNGLEKFTIDNKKMVYVYFIGLKQPNGKERGHYTTIDPKTKQVLDDGTYEYIKS